MIDVNQVRELVELMVEHELSEIRVREGETAVTLRKGPLGAPVVVTPPMPVPGGPPPPEALPAQPPPAPAASPPAAKSVPEDEGLVPIASPMVGTFYAAAEPDAPPFVQVGSEVTPETTVCVIEAMKVFNEIRAEVAGTIERISVQNEQAVEYGQPLMLVRPRA